MTSSPPCLVDESKRSLIDLFADTAAILILIASNSYYGMPRGQININLPPEYPIMSFETIKIKMTTVSAKRSQLLLFVHQKSYISLFLLVVENVLL